MSDTLSDIRKDDRNRPRYSQVEYEAAIKEAREDERRKVPTFDSIANEIRLTDKGYVKCNFEGECECDSCGKLSNELYTHLDWETNESDGWVCPDCAFRILMEAQSESFSFNMKIEDEHIKEILKERNPFNKSCFGNIHDCPCEDECTTVEDCYKLAGIIDKHEFIVKKSVLEEIISKCNSEIQNYSNLFEDKDRYGRLKANYLIRDYCEALKEESK
jgi:DNA-directed RNA polymerase subunit RPC12/RpoP